MMSLSLLDLDAAPATLLRERRRALTPTWRCVSFAAEVLALDLQVLERHLLSGGDHLDAIIDHLPDLMSGHGDDAWVLPMDIPELDLHREMAASDLDNPDVARSLLVRINARRRMLIERKHRLEEEMDGIRETLLRQYAAGTASTDDWLN
jgi:hypothetical protein